MRNKGVVVVLTIIVTALCLYYLSFTFVSRKVEQDAIAYATNSSGSVDLSKKQSYMDSLWSKPVYNLFGAEYTFKEVKENELSLGLDLQGGMHVTLEVSPIDIIKGLSGNNQDPAFMDALHKASEMQRSSQERYSALFFRAYKEANPGQNLAHLFASAANKDRVSLSDDDAKVMAFVNAEIESAIDRSFTILKTRIDQFGTSQPNIQKLQGTGRIQIEIPGADNPARVRKLLQGVARLEFWDVVEYNDEQLNQSLFAINQKLVKEQEANKALKPLEAANEVQDTLVEEGDSTKSQLEKQLSLAQKGQQPYAAQHERYGNEIDQHIHCAFSYFRRSAFSDTVTDEADIASAAISGVASPAKATGTARRL